MIFELEFNMDIRIIWYSIFPEYQNYLVNKIIYQQVGIGMVYTKIPYRTKIFSILIFDIMVFVVIYAYIYILHSV